MSTHKIPLVLRRGRNSYGRPSIGNGTNGDKAFGGLASGNLANSHAAVSQGGCKLAQGVCGRASKHGRPCGITGWCRFGRERRGVIAPAVRREDKEKANPVAMSLNSASPPV